MRALGNGDEVRTKRRNPARQGAKGRADISDSGPATEKRERF